MVTRRATPLRHVTAGEASRTRLVALVLGRAERARIADAVGSTYDVQFAATVEDARRAIATSEPLVLIAEPRDQCGFPSAPLLRELRANRPEVPLIGYCGTTRDASHDIVELAASGMHELLLLRLTDTPFTIQQTVRSAVRICASAAIAERVRPSIPREIGLIVDHCLRYPREATSVATVSRALGIHRKTLVNRCARAGAPAPGAVIAWCRLLVAAQLVRSRVGSVEMVSLLLDFPSVTSLRNMIKRYAGMRPLEARDGVGFERLLAMFEAALGGTPRAHARIEDRQTA